MKLNPKSEWFRLSNDGLRFIPQTWEGLVIAFGGVAILVTGIVLFTVATR